MRAEGLCLLIATSAYAARTCTAMQFSCLLLTADRQQMTRIPVYLVRVGVAAVLPLYAHVAVHVNLEPALAF